MACQAEVAVAGEMPVASAGALHVSFERKECSDDEDSCGGEVWVCKKCTFMNRVVENVYHCEMCDSFQPREPPICPLYGSGDVSLCLVFPDQSPMFFRRLYYLYNLSMSLCTYPQDIVRIIVDQYLLFDYDQGHAVDVCYGHVWYTAKVINLIEPKAQRRPSLQLEGDEDDQEEGAGGGQQEGAVGGEAGGDLQDVLGVIVHQRHAPVRPGLIYQRVGHPGAGGSSGGWMPVDPEEIVVNFVQIRYDGWSDRWDEWLPVNSNRLEPFRAKSTGDTSAQKTRHLHMARTPKISLEDVQTIMELGFPWHDAQQALLLSHNNVEHAIALLQHAVDQDEDDEEDIEDDEEEDGNNDAAGQQNLI
eukprot:TRINITY_DN4469_c0_g1_i1.p1 TRINITY_DN4469_c0_g1~~TRINITY_DN4469_c0_g1_i1.p1  ORF type:complete len:360 (+),score=65.18 TRINITY_DN4469_c0_g1_i1:29-1108(+)